MIDLFMFVLQIVARRRCTLVRNPVGAPEDGAIINWRLGLSDWGLAIGGITMGPTMRARPRTFGCDGTHIVVVKRGGETG